MSSTNPNQLIESNLSEAAQILDRIVRIQLDQTMEAVLDLRSLSRHLRILADRVSSAGLPAAGEIHRNFAVMPHASWLAQRPRKSRTKDSYRLAGKKGGASRSVKKISASKQNGMKGGRPAFNDEPFIKRLIDWTISPTIDPDYPAEVANSVLRSIPKLPVRLRRKVIKRLIEAKADVGYLLKAAPGVKRDTSAAVQKPAPASWEFAETTTPTS